MTAVLVSGAIDTMNGMEVWSVDRQPQKATASVRPSAKRQTVINKVAARVHRRLGQARETVRRRQSLCTRPAYNAFGLNGKGGNPESRTTRTPLLTTSRSRISRTASKWGWHSLFGTYN